MDSALKSLSLSSNHTEVIAACASGNIYRCLIQEMTKLVAAVSHTKGVSCIAFAKSQAYLDSVKASGAPYFFATATLSGEIRVWDLTDYACLSVTKFPKSGGVLALCMIDNENILSGWEDGSVRCINSSGQTVWHIPTAHRDGTTTVAAYVDKNVQFMATGGGDGAVRVWKYSNRELITQYTEHRRTVAKVLIDEKSPNIVHSVGIDCSVLSFDCKAARRIICHIVNNGLMTNMTQRKDSETELITCDSMGRLLHWDIDYRDPVLMVQDPSRATIKCCEVSPSGRFLAYVGEDQLLKVLDLQQQQIISVGQSHSGTVNSVAWTPDERQLISGGEDCCLAIWNFYLGGM